MAETLPGGELGGRTVLVTGAASGIGEGVARGLARQGVKVVLADINADQGQAIALDIGSNARFQFIDTGDEQSIEAAFATVDDLYGLVNVAAILTRIPFLEMRGADYDRLANINLRGYLLCAREAAKKMIAGGAGGAIVNISSLNAHRGAKFLVHYGASKGGVLASTRAMAVELAEHQIRVNSVSPGVIATAINAERLSDPAQVAFSAAKTALGRIGTPADLVGAVEFLLSSRAAFVTGADILVDGGERAR